MFKLKAAEQWEAKAAKLLVGRTIVEVRYLTPREVEGLGWHHSGLVLGFDDKSILIVSCDDEGNDAGAALYQSETADGDPIDITLPRI
jgi:hypothetical protein